MAKASFSRPKKSTEPAEEPKADVSPESKAPAVREDRSPSTSIAGGEDNEFKASDIRWPRLNLANKLGDLGEQFTPGSFVFDKTLLLTDGKKPLKVIVFGLNKTYQESVAWGEDSKVVKTEAEVRREGGTTDYDQAVAEKIPWYQPKADLLLLIEAPEGIAPVDADTHFIYEADGKQYTPAVFTASKGAYKTTAREVISDKMVRQRANYFESGWNLVAEVRKNAKGSWFTPVLKRAPSPSPEVQALIRRIINPEPVGAEE